MPVPIIELQRRLTLVGAIRAGAEKPERGPGRRLESFRLTSPRQALVTQAAELYGGKVSNWTSPVGREWQVYTEAEEIPVLVMPGYSLRQAYELWEGATKRTRLCDGLEEELSGGPCLCAAEGVDRCDLYTRLVVALPELDTVLGWRLISRGVNAGHELPTMMTLAEARSAGSPFVPARLRLDERRGVVDEQVVRYVVPTLDFGVGYLALAGADGARAALPPAPGFTPAERRGPTVGEALDAIADPAGPAAGGRTAPMGPHHAAQGGRPPLPILDGGEDEPSSPGHDRPPLPADPPEAKATRRMHALYREAGITERADKLAFAVATIGREIRTSTELTAGEVTTIQNALVARVGRPGPADPPATLAYRQRIVEAMRDLGMTRGEGVGDERLAYISTVAGREVASTSELTIGEASKVVDRLEADKAARAAGEQAFLDELRGPGGGSTVQPAGGDPGASGEPEGGRAGQDQRDRLRALFFDNGIADGDERLAYAGGVLERRPGSLDELTEDEASTLIAHVEQYDLDDPQTWPFPDGF